MRLSRVARLAAFALAAVAAYSAYDLWGPRSHDLRDFDPAAVARLETDMWRSYYSHDRLKLFLELGSLLRTQYGFPPIRSWVNAFHAARAAAVFQRGHARPDYELALPDLNRFYQAIAAVSPQRFDVPRAARLELEWWIVHRERARHAPNDLADSLAALQAELYRQPAAVFASHAKDRADAMLLRDTGAEQGGPTEAQWTEIARLLDRSWTAHWQAIHPGT